MASTEIKHCPNCAQGNITHAFQDAQYGKFNRMFNISEKGTATCTVCNSGKVKKK